MSSYMLQTLSNAIDVIDIFESEPNPLNIQEIMQRTNMNRTSLYRILYTLREKGILEMDGTTGKYRLGIKMVQLSSLVLQRLDIRKIARPFLEELRDKIGETVHLVVMNENNSIFIDKLEIKDTIFMGSYIGWVAPLYCTASGKLLLSYQSEEFIENYMKAITVKSYTYKTIVTNEDLKKSLKLIRKNGYSFDNEEMVEGLKCIAAPITNGSEERAIAAISISGPTSRMSVKQDTILDTILHYTKLISLELSKTTGVFMRIFE